MAPSHTNPAQLQMDPAELLRRSRQRQLAKSAQLRSPRPPAKLGSGWSPGDCYAQTEMLAKSGHSKHSPLADEEMPAKCRRRTPSNFCGEGNAAEIVSSCVPKTTREGRRNSMSSTEASSTSGSNPLCAASTSASSVDLTASAPMVKVVRPSTAGASSLTRGLKPLVSSHQALSAVHSHVSSARSSPNPSGFARMRSIPSTFISSITGGLFRPRWAPCSSLSARQANEERAEAEHYRQRVANFAKGLQRPFVCPEFISDPHSYAWNPHEIPVWKRVIGISAGIAGDEFPIPAHWHIPQSLHPAVRFVLWIIFATISVTIALLFIPAIAWDLISYAYFYAHSILEAYHRYRRLIDGLEPPSRQSSPPSSPVKYPVDQSRWANQPWGGTFFLADCLFVMWATALSLFHWIKFGGNLAGLKEDHGRLVIDSTDFESIGTGSWFSGIWAGLDLISALGRHIRGFRRYLGDHSPDFPISCNDQIFMYDECARRFQLSMLVVLENVSYEEIKDGFRRRWINWEPKTRAVISKMHGRKCFKMLHGTEFNLDDHILRKEVDLGEFTLAQVVSQICTQEMPAGKPQWQVWVLEVYNSVDPEDPTAGFSYVFGKWNHVYADGSGMMAAIVTRLGDRGVDVADLPEKYRRRVPKWQANVFYAFHTVRAALVGLRVWCYYAWGMGPYPALLQPHRDVVTKPLPATGIKHYSAPGVFSLDEINLIRTGIRKFAEVAMGGSGSKEPAYAKVLAGDGASSDSGTSKSESAQGDLDVREGSGGELARYLVASATPSNPGRPKPTVNDVFAYCITNAFAQLQDPDQLENIIRNRLMLPPKPRVVPTGAAGALPVAPRPKHVQAIIPMMCRTSLPNCMDNFTSLAATKLALSESDNWISSAEIEQAAATIADSDSLDPREARALILSARKAAARQLFANKKSLDGMKQLRLREAAFLVVCSWCKALPECITKWLFHEMYSHMQVISTNVAAPPIDAAFLGRIVHGLFFWPAVPSMLTIGTSVVSLGTRFQLLSVLDESELLAATDLAWKIYEEEGLTFTEATCGLVIDSMSDILVTLVVEEFERLKLLFEEYGGTAAQMGAINPAVELLSSPPTDCRKSSTSSMSTATYQVSSRDDEECGDQRFLHNSLKGNS